MRERWSRGHGDIADSGDARDTPNVEGREISEVYGASIITARLCQVEKFREST